MMIRKTSALQLLRRRAATDLSHVSQASARQQLSTAQVCVLHPAFSRFSLPPCFLAFLPPSQLSRVLHPCFIAFSSLFPCFLGFPSTLSSFSFRSSNFSARTSSLETHSLLSHFSLLILSQSPLLLHFSLYFFKHCCLVFLLPFVSISFITIPIAFSLIHSFLHFFL